MFAVVCVGGLEHSAAVEGRRGEKSGGCISRGGDGGVEYIEKVVVVIVERRKCRLLDVRHCWCRQSEE